MEQIKRVEEALSSKMKEAKGCGKYAAAVADSCKKALLEFAKQDEEFAQAIIEGSFVDCMKAVEKQLSGKKAVSDKYEAELARLRKEANKPPVVMNEKAIEVNILFDDLQEIYARIVSLLDGVDRKDPALGKKLRTAIKAALGQMMEGKA